MADNRLAEDTGGFSQGHGGDALERGTLGQIEIVIAVSQFMSQRAHATEGGLKIGEYPRLIFAQRRAIGSIALPGAWLGIDPVFVKCTGRETGEVGGVSAKLLNNKCCRLVVFPDPAA